MNVVTNNQQAKALIILVGYSHEMNETEKKYFENIKVQKYITETEKLDFQRNDYYYRARNSGLI